MRKFIEHLKSDLEIKAWIVYGIVLLTVAEIVMGIL